MSVIEEAEAAEAIEPILQQEVIRLFDVSHFLIAQHKVYAGHCCTNWKSDLKLGTILPFPSLEGTSKFPKVATNLGSQATSLHHA